MADGRKALGVNELSHMILVTPDLRDPILEFTKLLDEQGILKMFIDGDSLDELVFLMNSLDILSGEYSKLDYCKSNLRNYFGSHLIRQAALKLCSLNANTEIDLKEQIQLMLKLWKSPKHSSDLFLVICDLGVKLRKVYSAAIDRYIMQVMNKGLFVVPKGGDSEEIFEYWQTMTQNKDKLGLLIGKALPLGIENTTETLAWMKEKDCVLSKVDFTSLDGNIDFEDTYYSFFGKTEVVGSGLSKDEVKERVNESFHALILNDVFIRLKNKKNRTSRKISEEILRMVKMQSIRVNLRYVQAFFMFYREDAKIMREHAQRSVGNQTIPFATNGWFGGSNIPN